MSEPAAEPGGTVSSFRNVNTVALDDVSAWVPQVFSRARRQDRTGA